MNKSIFSINSLSKYSDLFQIIGVIGLIASLIFVGLELRQSHKIALAAQQQARASMLTNVYQTYSLTDVSALDIYKDWEDREKLVFTNFIITRWIVAENDYLQYRLGLMDEDMWKAKYLAMLTLYKGVSNKNCSTYREVWNRRSRLMDQNLVKLIEDNGEACIDPEST